MLKFERPDHIIIDGERRFSSAVDEAYYNFFGEGSKKKPEMIKKRSRRMSLLDMDEFDDGYSGEEIFQDKEKIRDLRKDSSEEFVFDESELFEFFMSDPEMRIINAIKLNSTLEYDDRINHTDAWGMMKTHNEGGGSEFPKIAFDFTIAREEDVLDKKKKLIASEISLGKLTNLKYTKRKKTKNGKSELHFGIEQIPRVIINCSKSEIEKMCAIQSPTFSRKNTSATAKNYFQVNFLEESLNQLEKQSQCLEQNSQVKTIILDNLKAGIETANPKINSIVLTKNTNLLFKRMKENLNLAIKALREKIRELKPATENEITKKKLSDLIPKINSLDPDYEEIISRKTQGKIGVWQAA